MKRKLVLAVLLAMIAPAVWLGSGGNDNGQDYSLGFGKQIAGGWLATLDLGYAQGDILLTLAADGGLVSSGQLREESPGWMNTRYNTTGHGSWTRTGQNMMSMVLLLQVQDNDGNLVFYEKAKMETTLNKAGTKMEGAGGWQLFEKGKDPLDPKSPVFLEGLFTETLRRIQ